MHSSRGVSAAVAAGGCIPACTGQEGVYPSMYPWGVSAGGVCRGVSAGGCLPRGCLSGDELRTRYDSKLPRVLVAGETSGTVTILYLQLQISILESG